MPLPQHITAVHRFIAENGHEPSFRDFDATPYLPSTRQIQRRFGGLKAFRKELGLAVTDYTKGATRSEIARNAQRRAAEYEATLFHKLYAKYHDEQGFTKTVIRAYAYQQYSEEEGYTGETRCDAAIVDRVNKNVILIDFFYASTIHSFGGCLRIKRKKFENHPVRLMEPYTYENIVVSVNPALSQEALDNCKVNRGGLTVFSYDTFHTHFLLH